MNRIRQLREETNTTQEDVANAIGISYQALGLYEREKRSLKPNHIMKLCEYFNVSSDYLLGYSDIRDKVIENGISYIPIYGTVKAGYNYFANENIIGQVKVESSLVKDKEGYFALRVKGDSMYPVILEDDIVIVKKQSSFENNQVVIALINNNEVTIKKARATDTGIVLVPFNTCYDPMFFTDNQIQSSDIIILGVVKHLTRNL